MKKHILFLSFILLSAKLIHAHEGHSHSSLPAMNSSTNFLDLASAMESPLTFSLKTRLGHEGESYSSIQPGIYSFLGDDQVSTHLSYEYRFRNYLNQSSTETTSFDNHHKISVNLKKSIFENLKLSALAEYEQNGANSQQRAVNNYNLSSANILLTKAMNTESSLSAGYQYSNRSFPNGTYSIPIPHQMPIGEPILPTEFTPATDEIIKSGVEDAEHDLTLSGNTSFGTRTLSLEARQTLNYSNFKTRQYQAQALKASVDSTLWKRASLLLAQSVESRHYTENKQDLLISEIHLIQEISPKLSLLGFARYSQIETFSARNWWEGYAQLQLIF